MALTSPDAALNTVASPPSAKSVYEFGPFQLDPEARLLLRAGEVVPLTSKVFETLLILVTNSGQVVEKQYLIRALWPDTFVEDSNLVHNISVLRKTLGEASRGRPYIQTIPKRGYQFAAEVNVRLGDNRTADVREPKSEPLKPRRRRARRSRQYAIAAIGVVAMVLLGRWVARSLQRSPALSMPTFMQLTDEPGQELYPSLSPEGATFVYARDVAGTSDIFLQWVNGNNALNLTKNCAEDDTHPAFSPDGRYIVYRSECDGGGIFVMGATGESLRRLTDFGYHPAWSPDGREIVCSTATFTRPDVRYGSPGRLYRVSVATGEKSLVNGKIEDAVQPSWSPHGYRIAFWGLRQSWQRDIWTVAAGGGDPVPVTDDYYLDWNPVWSPDGRHLYFSSDRSGSVNLWRVAIDEKSGKVLSTPEPVTTPSPYSGYISFSADGRRMAYVQQVRTSNVQKVRFDAVNESAVGAPDAVTRRSREAYYPDLSPDGRSVVLAALGSQEDLFTVGSDGSGLRHLTDDSYKDRAPAWSPDGKRIAFMSNRSGKFEIWTIQPDGSGLQQLTNLAVHSVLCPVWSPDGMRLAGTPMGFNSFIMDAHVPWKDQTVETLPSLPQPNHSFMALSWSRDGRLLAGDRMTAGGSAAGVSVYSFQTRTYHTLTAFGNRPHWLSDSRRLVFCDRHKIYCADTGSGRFHEVLSIAPYEIQPYNIVLSGDDRLIYFSVDNSESDIWLMRLN